MLGEGPRTKKLETKNVGQNPLPHDFPSPWCFFLIHYFQSKGRKRKTTTMEINPQIISQTSEPKTSLVRSPFFISFSFSISSKKKKERVFFWKRKRRENLHLIKHQLEVRRKFSYQNLVTHFLSLSLSIEVQEKGREIFYLFSSLFFLLLYFSSAFFLKKEIKRKIFEEEKRK